ncbi:phage tail assembly protein [Xanthobacter wiegelii]|uniref:phage tail assembly protein n=1 Tax=Xanthobacter wiegelii TaxID=3119913 RepID=UPI00372A904A
MTAKITDNADGTKTVHLSAPVTTYDGQVREVVLRAPTYSDFMALGDPTSLIIAAGSALPQDDMVVIRQYVERLSSVPPEHLTQIHALVDAMALAEAVKRFFREASAGISTPSPTPSSSTSAGPSEMSAA